MKGIRIRVMTFDRVPDPGFGLSGSGLGMGILSKKRTIVLSRIQIVDYERDPDPGYELSFDYDIDPDPENGLLYDPDPSYEQW